MMQKLSIPKGTRDFSPKQMAKRNHIFNTIKAIFHKYGFAQLETPAMENLSVLIGKYGDEGDQLIFKIINTGDYLKKCTADDYPLGSNALLPKITSKGLKYDLTVPFARYVVMHQHDITFPFKRFQMQPVWRADRPQRGRYREFYQCDADVIGTDSLLPEAEIIRMINDVFDSLWLQDFTIKINNRKILTGIAEVIGARGKADQLCVVIDKLDKIGLTRVKEELSQQGFEQENIDNLDPIFTFRGSLSEKLTFMKSFFTKSTIGLEGLKETAEILGYLEAYQLVDHHLELDLTLARGLSYYTGTIFEVQANGVNMGSITGGGRYDNLTGAFGLKNVSGVGISFGVDRIYDVLEELNLYPDTIETNTEVMIVHLGTETLTQSIKFLEDLRHNNIKAELYPSKAKMKKQLTYANNLNIPYVAIIGSDEVAKKVCILKDMVSGVQSSYKLEEVVLILKNSR